MKLKGEKILVTGGAGFIGSHLCDRFIAEGAEVVCLDNLSTGFKQNIQQVMGHERFTFTEGDIPHSMGSIRKAENDLKYSANISFSAGLMKTINYYLVESSCRPIGEN